VEGRDYAEMIRDFIDPETHAVLASEMEGSDFHRKEELLDEIIDTMHIPESMIEKLHPDGSIAEETAWLMDDDLLTDSGKYFRDPNARPETLVLIYDHIGSDVKQKLNPKFNTFKGVKVIPVESREGRTRRVI
jgi:hypothetical protein